MPNQFDTERDLVDRLLEALGLRGVLSDPKKTHGRETGADVEVRLGQRRIAVQVTQYHGNEGTGGSALRAQEESDAARGLRRAYAVPTDASAGLTKRFSDKIAKAERYTFEEFTEGEVWLLVAAWVPQYGASAATTLIPIFIRVEWLERHFSEALRASKYRRAFLHVYQWPSLYQWSPESGWQVVREPEKLSPDVGHLPQRGAYIMKTGKPRWSVGYVQNGPKHDAGLRCFVCERASGGEIRAVAYTETPEDAEMLVAALEHAGD
ncbi:MAG: hypothetical protein A3I00_05810 [Betaproteobacteria bacterium RIFCSPLOWO2_02_FULL_64_12]|nr:MAG: hypothetical protein A3I00_05810 [Betaproteobacteria bacterium RIFCSPLOWO2_02_FULL_64_12]